MAIIYRLTLSPGPEAPPMLIVETIGAARPAGLRDRTGRRARADANARARAEADLRAGNFRCGHDLPRNRPPAALPPCRCSRARL